MSYFAQSMSVRSVVRLFLPLRLAHKGVTAAVYDGYGTEFKKHGREIFGNAFGLAGRGEMIPNRQSWIEIDPQTSDAYGIPVLRFHWEWGDEELAMVRHMEQTFEEIIDAASGKIIDRQKGISAGGEILHELGTAQMGSDPRTSVLNAYNQAHDVEPVRRRWCGLFQQSGEEPYINDTRPLDACFRVHARPSKKRTPMRGS
jgi:choline dehydrogenase-like flavoprotein